MRLRKLIGEGEWATLQADGELRGDPRWIEDEEDLPSHGWMRDRMVERIGAGGLVDPWPLWAWRRRYGNDVPPATDYAKTGRPFLLLEFEIESADVVLSDFEDWEDVMNGFYVSAVRGAEDEREASFYEEFHEAGLRTGRFDGVGPLWDEMRSTWERIFDVASSEDVQASFWRIDLSMVRGLSCLVVDETGSRWEPDARFRQSIGLALR